MITLQLTQGSQEWLEARKNYFTASEAPAMMGECKYHSRTQLLDHKKGWTTEVDDFTQRLFDKGHKSEADALPIVEKIIGDELYPSVGVLEGAKLLASFDGLTMMEDVIYEHKIFNKVLAENVLNKILEPHYFWQLEHQLLVSGADKVIFVTSDGTEQNMKHMLYESVPERREKLIAGWAQFEKDLANHQPQAKADKVQASVIRDLPAIRYEMNGLTLTSNLDEYKAAADALLVKAQGVIETDQDFADADARQKVFTKAEADIKDLAEKVLNEVADISEFTKDLKYIGEQIRQARLAEGKQIKARKEEIRTGIIQASTQEVLKFGIELFSKLGLSTPLINISIADAMKGKKTIDSLQDAADTAVSQIKTELYQQHAIAQANADFAKQHSEYKFLLMDWKEIALKPNEDFQALIKSRIADHKAEEEKRAEVQRERIRAEERAKAEREATEKLDAERKEREGKERAERLAEMEAKAEADKQAAIDAEVSRKEELLKSNAIAKEQSKQAEKVKQYNSNEQFHTDKDVTPTQLTDYQKGYLDGLKAYAWVERGIHYVGKEGQTLEAATSLFLARKDAA